MKEIGEKLLILFSGLVVGFLLCVAFSITDTCPENHFKTCQPVPELVDCKNQCAPNDFEYVELSVINEGIHLMWGTESPSGCYCIERTKVK